MMKEAGIFGLFLAVGLVGVLLFAVGGGDLATTASKNVGMGTAFTSFGFIFLSYSQLVGTILIFVSGIGIILYAIVQFVLQVKCELGGKHEKEAEDDTSFKCHI